MSGEITHNSREENAPLINKPSIHISEFFKKKFTNFFINQAKKNLEKDV